MQYLIKQPAKGEIKLIYFVSKFSISGKGEGITVIKAGEKNAGSKCL